MINHYCTPEINQPQLFCHGKATLSATSSSCDKWGLTMCVCGCVRSKADKSSLDVSPGCHNTRREKVSQSRVSAEQGLLCFAGSQAPPLYTSVVTEHPKLYSFSSICCIDTSQHSFICIFLLLWLWSTGGWSATRQTGAIFKNSQCYQDLSWSDNHLSVIMTCVEPLLFCRVLIM